MERLATLWKYQEIDLIMDQYIQEKRNCNSRQKLVKIRDYLIKQEETLMSMDKDAVRRSNLLSKLQQDCDEIDKQIQERIKKLESEEFDTLSELEELMTEGIQLKDSIAKKEAELKRLAKDLNNFQSKLNSIRGRVAKAKKEYQEIKKVYDKEVEGINKKLAEQKEKRDEVEKAISKELLSKYKNIKAGRTPVITPLIGNQCGGCFMSLASLVFQRVKENKQIVECENCGRILFDKESISG